jgi:signal transduction histidine kinase
MPAEIEEDVATIGVIDAIPKLLEVICQTTGMGFAAVARVTEDRWVACAVRDQIGFGLQPGGELVVATTICDEIRDHGRAIVIDHVSEEPAWCGHPTPLQYGFQSYISVPIHHDGKFFGTLCAIDPQPRKLRASSAQATFELFAELIGQHLAARERLAVSQAALLSQREAAELREQFIAVMGHDLRNPLASVDAAARLLQKTPLNERAQMLVHTMQGSVQRMAGLIDNVLDLARARLGGGFQIERRRTLDLRTALEQVIDEIQLAHPERPIQAHLEVDAPVDCDSRRIAQLFSNLLGNALTHGASDKPIRLQARTTDSVFELAVANGGEPIPDEALRRLFQPFTRAALRPHQQGLGLGLYIAAEIARAHEGTLEVTSDAEETRFTFRMPLLLAGARPQVALAEPA